MKALLSVAVFGLVAVPPTPPATTEEVKQLQLESDANDVPEKIKNEGLAPDQRDDIDPALIPDPQCW